MSYNRPFESTYLFTDRQDTESIAPAGSPQKRFPGSLGPTPSKKPRTTYTPEDNEKVVSQALANIPMLSIKGTTSLTLRIMVQNKVAIMNQGKDDANWNAGVLLAAFGKGAFCAKTAETMEPDKEILFKLESDESLVIYNNNMVTVGDLLSKRREEDPAATICYHKIVEEPGKPGYKFELTAQVVFQPKARVNLQAEGQEGGGPGALQASAAAMLPCHTWNTEHTSIMWSVQWKPNKGLMPIRPQVVFKEDGSLAPGKAIYMIS